MSLGLRDLHRIRGPLLAAGITIALAVGTALVGHTWQQQAQTRHSAAVAAADAAKNKADAAVADRKNVETYKLAFDSLRQRGVIGLEQRLPWVEFFTQMSLAGNPVSFSLQIAPRRTLEDPPTMPEPLENLQFYASKLSFDSKLLHDVDALRLLDRLSNVQGAAIVRNCDLKRASDGATASRPYLMQFKCEGDIITLDAPPANGPPQ